MRIGKVSNCSIPCSEQNSLYRLIPFGVCFWLLIKLMFRSPKMLTSCSLKLHVCDMDVDKISKNLD